MAVIRARIDGQPVQVPKGTTIIEAARGVPAADIPALCYRAGSPPQGGCRLCQVQVAGRDRPVAACCTPIADGDVIVTSTPEIEALRHDILELMSAQYPGALRAGTGGRHAGQFHALLSRYSLPHQSADRGASSSIPGSHPYLRFDAAACIVCRKCQLACEDLQGQFVFSIGNRGNETRLLFGQDRDFASSPCVSCGACVEECPTGALSDVDRLYDAGTTAARSIRSTCGYCGVGCSIDVTATGDIIARISGDASSPVNAGHLCAKGRYAHGWVRSAERLTEPLLRIDGRLRKVSWHEAMSWGAERIRAIQQAHGADSLAVLTSSRSTNEAAYLLQKLFRSILGTNNVDCCARVCHSSTALALRLATGTGAASASYADIERASTIVIAGANPTEAHPVIGARIKQAVRRGATLIIVDPRVTELAACASVHLQLRPGTNVLLFNAMAKVMVEESLQDAQYVAMRTEGGGELLAHLRRFTLAEAGIECGVAPEAIRQAARLIAVNGPTLFVTGLGLSELTQGTESVLALINVALLCGSVGRPGGGLLPLRGQNNVQGNADMGCAPDQLTGYQALTDPQVRNRFAAVWGQAPPASPGWTIPDMMAAARDGRLKGLWVQGEDPAQSDPNQSGVIESLRSLELLVVQELFLSETARYAHLVLPSASVFEQDGTFTNGERRIQRVRAVLKPPGEARPDWKIAVDLAGALGVSWTYENPGQVMDEIAAVAPVLFGGVSYDRLDDDGLQWPCPDRDHPGTATVHATDFMRGKGRLSVVAHAPSPETPCESYPFTLITGRALHHYNVGTMTRRTANLDLATCDWLDINPADASRLGLAAGDRVVIESRHGRTEAPVRTTTEVPMGVLFLTFHFPETHANALIGPNFDPQSHCPEYKLTAVTLQRALVQ